MLELFRENIRSGVESMKQAKGFVARIESLTRMEREFLQLALRDARNLEELCTRFPSEEVAEETQTAYPRVASIRSCGFAAVADEGTRLSAG